MNKLELKIEEIKKMGLRDLGSGYDLDRIVERIFGVSAIKGVVLILDEGNIIGIAGLTGLDLAMYFDDYDLWISKICPESYTTVNPPIDYNKPLIKQMFKSLERDSVTVTQEEYRGLSFMIFVHNKSKKVYTKED